MDIFRRLFSKSTPSPKDEVHPPATEIATPNVNPSDAPAAVTTEPTPAPAGFDPSSADTWPVAVPVEAVAAMPSVVSGATRPLPPEAVISSQNEHLIFGQSSDVGMVRSNNQDSALSVFFTNHSAEEHPDFGLFLVADGMGGHHDGEKASAIASRVVASQVTNNIYLPMLNTNGDTQRSSINDMLIAAVQKANSAVMTHVPEGGTTVTVVTLIGDLAYFAHVGDSRVYLITKDGMEQITRDHSLVQRLIELDQLTPSEAADHPQKNVLYRALGQTETLEVDTLTRRLPPNSRLLLCSDGLWGQVKSNEILETVTNYPNPQEACDKLVALANAHGGIDNITAILLKLPSN